MIAPLAPTLPPPGVGGAVRYLGIPEISRRLCTGTMAQSQPGDAIAAGACLHTPENVRIIQRISHENHAGRYDGG